MISKCIVSTVIAAVFGIGVGYCAAKQCPVIERKSVPSESQSALQRFMKKLWIDQTIWYRQLMVSTIAGLNDIDACKDRLLKNQYDLGNILVPYYGKNIGTQFTMLLKEHMFIGDQIIKASMAKNDAWIKDLDEQWRTNTIQMVQLLNRVNPHWTKMQLTAMFNKHLDLLSQDIHLRLNGNWEAEIAKADEVIAQIRVMGKDLADGIVKQFPERF